MFDFFSYWVPLFDSAEKIKSEWENWTYFVIGNDTIDDSRNLLKQKKI